jgi:predicted O-methyltransferase YrrM
MDMSGFQFTTNWFDVTARVIWEHLIPQVKPERILEIGSFEGASPCFLIQTLANQLDLEIHCIDTWEGGAEHQGIDMGAVETRFRHNVNLATSGASRRVSLHVHKGLSDRMLGGLLGGGKASYFDFIYVDGSHHAPDVLTDALLGFKLLKVGGVMAFDDYLWFEALPYGRDPLRCPKLAIDTFTNFYCRKSQLIATPLSQVWVQKTAE